jgi:hypothetical protein
MASYLPRHAAVPLQLFVSTWKRNGHLLHLSMRGISILTSMPGIFSTLIENSGLEEKAQLASDLAEAKKEAQLAEEECKTGFPLLHAHALVAMWAALEAAIEDMLVGILLNEPETLKKEAFAKIRVPFADFETKNKEERMRFLIDELGRNLGRKNGVDAFEGLLHHFELSGSVTEEDRKLVWQTHHLRNVFVHRAACADRRLVEACPWLQLRVNDPVTVSHGEFVRCARALSSYALTITHRLGKRYAVDTHALIRDAGLAESQPILEHPESSKN